MRTQTETTVDVQGTSVPALGFGTWQITGPAAEEGVRDALEIGSSWITAYSPLAHGKVLDEPTLTRIGEAHGVSPGVVALRWLLDQPLISPIPKASSHDRRVENWQALSLELSDERRAEIDALPKDVRTADADFCTRLGRLSVPAGPRADSYG